MRGEGPLRYPGAKSNLSAFVAAFLERHRLAGVSFIEPFGGSAAVSRHLLNKHLVSDAQIWELDPGLYAFWRAVLYEPSKLIRRVAEAQVTLDEFDRCTAYLQALADAPDDEIEAGYAFLFLNRTSYSGIVGAGPIGGRSQSSAYPLDCRFNKTAIEKQIRHLSTMRGRLVPNFGDGISAIAKATNSFVYADPPYFSNGKKFYRKHFKTFDHYRLRMALRQSQSLWLLSYDYDRKVEYLYRQFPTERIALYHSARGAGSKEELIVSPLGFAGLLHGVAADTPALSYSRITLSKTWAQ